MLKPSCPVLVVEDDDSFRKPLIAALDQAHFTVTAASTAEEALRLFESRMFQVIILDLKLPGQSGYDLLNYIRDNREKVPSHIIIVSGVGPHARQDADLSIAEEVLLKPVDYRYVAQRAQKYCSHLSA